MLVYPDCRSDLSLTNRLVTGLMDRLDHKLGREGLRARVRTVASSQAKARGKENLAARSPRLSQEAATKNRVSGVSARSPLRTNAQESEAGIIPPAAGKQIPRTPVAMQQPQQFIPKGKQTKGSLQLTLCLLMTGKQLPRTPPSASSSIVSQSSAASSCPDTASSLGEVSPSPAVRSRRTRDARANNVHVSASEFDTPVTAEESQGRVAVRNSSLAVNTSNTPASDKVLEAPGRFASRDMLARTPLCPPQRLQDNDVGQDDSFPPPPPSEELRQSGVGNSADISPEIDLPPPPESLVTNVRMEEEPPHQHQAAVQDNNAETPDVRESRKLPTGRQLARTPAATSAEPELEDRGNEAAPVLTSAQVTVTATSDLPSGNYALPQEMEKLAYNTESRESQESSVRMEEQQRKAEEVRRKKRDEAELKKKKQEIENLEKEAKRKIEEEKKQLEEMRKALMQDRKQFEMDKTKLKKEAEKVKRLSQMSDVHALNTNKAKSLLHPLPLSFSSKASALAEGLSPKTLSPSSNRLRGKKDGQTSPMIVKEKRSLTPRSSKASSRAVTTPIRDEVSSSVENHEEAIQIQDSEDKASRSSRQTSKVTKKDISEPSSSNTSSKKPEEVTQKKSPTVTQVETKRKSREEMRDEIMKANVEKRRDNTAAMLKRSEAVKEKARSRCEELEIGRMAKTKMLEKTKSVEPKQVSTVVESLDQTVTKADDSESIEKKEVANDSEPLSKSSSDSMKGLKVINAKPAKPRSTKLVTEKPEDSVIDDEVVKTTSKTTIGRRRGKPSNVSQTNAIMSDQSVAKLESPTKKLKLDKKLTLSSSKQKSRPIIKVSKPALLPAIDDVDSEESPFFTPVPKLSKRKTTNLKPQEIVSQLEDEVVEAKLENETTKAKSRKRKALEVTTDGESISNVNSPPKRGRAKKKVVEETPSSLDVSLEEKKPAPKRPAPKRQVKSKKKPSEEAVPEIPAEEETRRLSTRLESIEIQEKEDNLVKQPEKKQATKTGRGRKPKAKVDDSKPKEVEVAVRSEEPRVDPEKEDEDLPVTGRGRPKRSAKKKFDTLAGFAER